MRSSQAYSVGRVISVLLVSFVIIVLSPAWADAEVSTKMEITGLKCENRTNPMGMESGSPRFSWMLHSPKRGDHQTAYQVVVASTLDALLEGNPDLWDSGKVASEQSLDIAYSGRALTSNMECWWRVKVWDIDGVESDWSDPAKFTMGLLSQSEWKGKWIGHALDGTTQESAPAIMLRKEIGLPKEIKRATAHIAGLGYYELYINGGKVGDHVLDPGFTNYDKRVLYTSYDVTSHLNSGGNAFGVLLGTGWYDMPIPDTWRYYEAPWRCRPKMLMQVHIEYQDKSTETIVSDGSWRVSTDGPIRYNTVRGGESYDARVEIPNWNKPRFNDSEWKQAMIMPTPKGRLVSQKLPPIKVVDTIEPVNVTELEPGTYLFDLGQNIAGWARLTVSGPEGESLLITYGERLADDGKLCRKDIGNHTRGRFSTDLYILRGSGEETWEPRFTYHGFQYVQVSGASSKPNILGRVVHTAVESAGTFECSDPMINRIQAAARRTQLNNLHSIPEDCPHREKNGWLIDGLVTAEQAMMNFDMDAFYAKWLEDMQDAQAEDGGMPSIVPTPGWGGDGMHGSGYVCPSWGNTCILLPWYHYQQYGDQSILANNYEMMKRYLNYLSGRSEGNILEFGLGDWLEVGIVRPVRTPVALTSTIAYYHSAIILSRTARILGKTDEAAEYEELAKEIKKSFNARFLDKETGSYGKDTQTGNALPLFLDMVPAEHRQNVEKALIRDIVDERDGHVSSGFIGTRFVLDALNLIGRVDLAFDMVTKEDFPGWVNMVKDGGTTLWEAWDGRGSLNHPPFACVSAWFYRTLAGINTDEAQPGFKNTIIRPYIVGLDWVKASHNSRFGIIKSEWTKRDGGLTLRVQVPTNTTATVYVPAATADIVRESGSPAAKAPGVKFLQAKDGCQVFSVESGYYVFSVGESVPK